MTMDLTVTLHQLDLWQGEASYQRYAHNLGHILKMRDTLLVIANGRPPYDVVLGVPHQAAVGCSTIAEKTRQGRGRDADENAASYALVMFSELSAMGRKVKLVAACHFTDHDPNKKILGPYCQAVFSETPRLLLECHGAGPSRENEIEISSGSNPLISALDFGRRTVKYLHYRYHLAAQAEPGSDRAKRIAKGAEEDARLELPALQTRSLAFAGAWGIPALHVEAQPRFRIPADPGLDLPPDGHTLGRALARAAAYWCEKKLTPQV